MLIWNENDIHDLMERDKKKKKIQGVSHPINTIYRNKREKEGVL